MDENCDRGFPLFVAATLKKFDLNTSRCIIHVKDKKKGSRFENLPGLTPK